LYVIEQINLYKEKNLKIEIDIPDGKLCELVKKGIPVYTCPFIKGEGAPSSPFCGLHHCYLEGTENSTRKCKECKNQNR
jgi:hypothetical protein